MNVFFFLKNWCWNWKYFVIQLCEFRRKTTRLFEYDELFATMISSDVSAKGKIIHSQCQDFWREFKDKSIF